MLHFPPHHPVHHARIGLDDFHHFRRYVLLHIVRHRDAVIPVPYHPDCRVHRLQQALPVYPRQDEATLVQRLRTLRARADAHRREGLPDGSEE